MVVRLHAQAAGLDDGTGRHLSGQALHLLVQLFVRSLAGSGVATGFGRLGGQFVVERVQRINLDNVVAHDGTQGPQFLLILAHLGAVGRVGLLDAVDELCHFLAGGVQLRVDGVVIGAQGGVIVLQGDHLLGQFLLFYVQIADQLRFLVPDIQQRTGQDQGNGGKHPGGRLQTGVFLFTFLARNALQRIFSHNGIVLMV